MFGPDLLGELDLDRGRVEYDRDLHFAVAEERGWIGDPEQVHQDTGQAADANQHIRQATVASCYRRAGASSLLLGELDQAYGSFVRAAEVYAGLGLPYSRVMASMAAPSSYAPADIRALGVDIARSRPQDWLGRYLDGFGRAEETSPARQADMRILQDEIDAPVPDFPEPLLRQMAYPAVEEAAGAQRFMDDRDVWAPIVARLRAIGDRPIGVLGLPIARYVMLLEALESSSGGRVGDERINIALQPFALAFQEALSAAMSRRYHWQRLAMPFHPVEPDILGLFRMLARQVGDLARRLERMPLAPPVQTILLSGLEQ